MNGWVPVTESGDLGSEQVERSNGFRFGHGASQGGYPRALVLQKEWRRLEMDWELPA